MSCLQCSIDDFCRRPVCFLCADWLLSKYAIGERTEPFSCGFWVLSIVLSSSTWQNSPLGPSRKFYLAFGDRGSYSKDIQYPHQLNTIRLCVPHQLTRTSRELGCSATTEHYSTFTHTPDSHDHDLILHPSPFVGKTERHVYNSFLFLHFLMHKPITLQYRNFMAGLSRVSDAKCLVVVHCVVLAAADLLVQLLRPPQDHCHPLRHRRLLLEVAPLRAAEPGSRCCWNGARAEQKDIRWVMLLGSLSQLLLLLWSCQVMQTCLWLVPALVKHPHFFSRERVGNGDITHHTFCCKHG